MMKLKIFIVIVTNKFRNKRKLLPDSKQLKISCVLFQQNIQQLF